MRTIAMLCVDVGLALILLSGGGGGLDHRVIFSVGKRKAGNLICFLCDVYMPSLRIGLILCFITGIVTLAMPINNLSNSIFINIEIRNF